MFALFIYNITPNGESDTILETPDSCSAITWHYTQPTYIYKCLVTTKNINYWLNIFVSCQTCGSFRNNRRRPLLAPSPCCKHLPLLITIVFRLWLSLWVATSPCARPWTVRTTTTRPTTRTTRAGTATRTTRRPPASRGTPPAHCLSPRVSKNTNTYLHHTFTCKLRYFINNPCHVTLSQYNLYWPI